MRGTQNGRVSCKDGPPPASALPSRSGGGFEGPMEEARCLLCGRPPAPAKRGTYSVLKSLAPSGSLFFPRAKLDLVIQAASRHLGPGCYMTRKDTFDGVAGVRVWRLR